MNRPLTYLACPYTHEDEDVLLHRVATVNSVAASLISTFDLIVFSPISHSHPISLCGDLPEEWEFWKKQDEAFLSCCNQIFVCTLPGWKESTGVTAEIQIARNMGLPLYYVQFQDDEHILYDIQADTPFGGDSPKWAHN